MAGLSTTPSVSLDEYELGSLDAWNRNEQEGLQRVFVPIQQFHELPEHSRTFLCGRRGSGKSAIAIMSQQNPAWSACYVLPGESSQYGAYMHLVEDLEYRHGQGFTIDIQRFVKLLWTYCLQITVLQHTLTFAIENNLDDAGIGAFLSKRNFVSKSIGSLLHQTFEKALQQASGSGPAAAYGAIMKLMEEPEFIIAMKNVPSALGKHRLLIIFDTIESYKIYHDAMLKGLRGVVAALVAVMTSTWYSWVGIRFFLPAEVFEDVASEIPSKVIGSTVFLRWETGDLMRLVSRRWVSMLERTKLMQPVGLANVNRLVNDAMATVDAKNLKQNLWYENSFLPSQIFNKRNLPEDTFAFIFRHTQRRPREVLFVLNQIVTKAYARRELPHISPRSVVDGVHDRKTLQLIVTEALSPYDGYIDNIVDRARSTFYNRSRLFDLTDLRRFAKAFYDIGKVPNIQPERFVEFLLRAGVVGLLKPTDGTGTNTPYYAAEFEYLMQDHLPLTMNRQYCVHPALGDLFGMPPSPMRSIYPAPADGLREDD
jgi:hypothetical protein